MKVGDLVRCVASPHIDRLGVITDTLEDDELGYPMYEVIFSGDFAKTWFSPFEIKLVSNV